MIINQAKQAARERIWALLDAEGAVSPPGAQGHIPSFVGAEASAQRLTTLSAWQTAEVIKANPDRAQLPVRVLALEQRKLVYMAVPAMASEQPFYQLDPAQLGTSIVAAAASKGQQHWPRRSVLLRCSRLMWWSVARWP